MITRELIMAARRRVLRESAAARRACALNIPAIREIAAHGKTKAERALARRWLAIAEADAKGVTE